MASDDLKLIMVSSQLKQNNLKVASYFKAFMLDGWEVHSCTIILLSPFKCGNSNELTISWGLPQRPSNPERGD